MSINEEKVMVLKMLEQGKITSEEAIKLIEALDSSNFKKSTFRSGINLSKKVDFTDEVNKLKDKVSCWKKELKNNYGQKDFERLVDEFSSKVENLGKNVAVTTFSVADKIVDFVGSFVETNAFNIFGNYSSVEKIYEVSDITKETQLLVEGINGQINLKKHADSKILIKSIVRSPNSSVDGLINFENVDNEVSLKINRIGNLSVSHEVYVPDIYLKNITLITSNAKIYVEEARCTGLIAKTSNGHIELMGVKSDSICLKSKNAKILLSYVLGREIEITTNNSIVDIKHIKTENLKAITVNGNIYIDSLHNFEESSLTTFDLQTINAAIKVNINDMDKKGYKIYAHGDCGNINLLVPDLEYNDTDKFSKEKMVVAISKDFEGFNKKICIIAKTSNGLIEIVK